MQAIETIVCDKLTKKGPPGGWIAIFGRGEKFAAGFQVDIYIPPDFKKGSVLPQMCYEIFSEGPIFGPGEEHEEF